MIFEMPAVFKIVVKFSEENDARVKPRHKLVMLLDGNK